MPALLFWLSSSKTSKTKERPWGWLTGQGLGVVAEQYPGDDLTFTQHVYDDPNDNFQIGPLKITTNPMAKIENHSLIANADDPRNRQAMQDLARATYQ